MLLLLLVRLKKRSEQACRCRIFQRKQKHDWAHKFALLLLFHHLSLINLLSPHLVASFALQNFFRPCHWIHCQVQSKSRGWEWGMSSNPQARVLGLHSDIGLWAIRSTMAAIIRTDELLSSVNSNLTRARPRNVHVGDTLQSELSENQNSKEHVGWSFASRFFGRQWSFGNLVVSNR